MNEPRDLSRGLDPEDAAALAVLDELGRLDSPEDTSVPPPEDAIDLVLRKLHGDAIAMLAYALEPVAPPAALRGEILMLTVGESTQEVEPIVAAPRPERRPATSSTPATPSTVAPGLFAAVVPKTADLDVAAVRAELAAKAAPSASGMGRSGRSSGSSRAGWMALAASLVVALVGAGFWIAYLHSELQAQATRLAWAEKEWKQRATSSQVEVKELEQRLALMTSPAVTVFHLRCPGGSGPGATAHANVYVSADRKRWDLDVKGLASEPPGREYQLWFMIGDETRSGGCFSMQDGEVALLNPASFPPGTTGIAISVEPKGGSIRPTSPPILVSTPPVRL